MKRNRSLALEARTLLCNRLEIEPPCPDEMVATIATMVLPAGESGGIPLHEPDPLHARLLQHGIQIPVWSWPSPAGRFFRISAHLHNHIDEYSFLADVLQHELS